REDHRERAERDVVHSRTSGWLAAEQNLEHELAAEVGEEHEDTSGDDPAERHTPAPTIAPTPPQQCADGEPAEHREDALVREGERLAEELLGEEHPAHERHGEQHEADGD